MAHPALTSGSISKMLQGQVVPDKPVVQILGFKKISGQAGADRFRVNISDGLFAHTYAMLATQLNHMIPAGELDSYAIIRIDKFILNSVGEKRVLIILELTILAKGSDVSIKIGNPVQWSEDAMSVQNGSGGGAAVTNRTSGNGSVYPKQGLTTAVAGGTSSYNGKNITASKPAASSSGDTGPVIPIRDLNPYNGRYGIRARVTSKSDIRTWSKATGEGKLFNMTLLDDTGEIRMTAFNNAVDQFYDMIEVGKCYLFKYLQVKQTRREFNPLPHDYEATVGTETQIFPCREDTSFIPSVSYNFVEIANIEEIEKDRVIDVIGICKTVGDLFTFTSRQGKEMTKREITLVDKSCREITLTLWNKAAQEFSDQSQPVIAVKGAKVGEYNGKNLSNLSTSTLALNPDISEAHSLRGWFDNEGKYSESHSLSGIRGGGLTSWKVLRESNTSDLPEKGDFFMAKVFVVAVKKDSAVYMACPSPACSKKVVDMGNGAYRCEKCNSEYPEFKWRLMLQANFADFSGNVWATCFQESAETMLGYSADTAGQMQKDEPENFTAILDNIVFRSYIVKFKFKLETFNGETRRRASVVELNPLNPTEYAKKLTAEIKESGTF